jgi:hypothetical protein
VKSRRIWAHLAVTGLLLASASARAGDASALFREALRHDLDGSAADMRIAVDLYRRAAEAGLPEAQFNMAVMLDSGRGVKPDVAAAAVWYARAAAHGNRRAAFNLGQLYEAGEGVPKNPDLARAWFQASDLPAARTRLAAVRRPPAAPGSVLAPVLLEPANEAAAAPGSDGIELVWTSPAQPRPVRFFVEARAISANGSREIYAGFVETSSLAVPLANVDEGLAWRVLAVVGGNGSGYAASPWSYLGRHASGAPGASN